MNSTYELAQRLLDDNVPSDEEASSIRSIMAELEENRRQQDEFDRERTEARERFTRRAAELSEAEANLTQSLMNILPRNPIPEQRIG